MSIQDYTNKRDKQINKIQSIKQMVQDLDNEILVSETASGVQEGIPVSNLFNKLRNEDKIWDIINELSNLQDML